MRWRSTIVVGMALMLAAVGCDQHLGFDRARWEEGRGKIGDRNPRAEMVDEAVAAGLRPGAARERVRELLGAPDAEDSGGDLYYLGRQRWAPELHSLHIYYDEQGVVTLIEVRE